jgi:hypothetical protein
MPIFAEVYCPVLIPACILIRDDLSARIQGSTRLTAMRMNQGEEDTQERWPQSAEVDRHTNSPGEPVRRVRLSHRGRGEFVA